MKSFIVTVRRKNGMRAYLTVQAPSPDLAAQRARQHEKAMGREVTVMGVKPK